MDRGAAHLSRGAYQREVTRHVTVKSLGNPLGFLLSKNIVRFYIFLYSAITDSKPESAKMETYKTRQFALSIASHLERCANPAGYIKRKKVTVTPLIDEYRAALRGFLKTECVAAAEHKADEVVSAAHGWPTIAALRAESLEAMRRQYGV